MKKRGSVGIVILVIVIILGLSVSFFYMKNSGEKDLPSSEDNQIPDTCLDFKDDVCELFGCMVDLCWCENSPNAVLYEQEGISISTTKEAVDYVKKYDNNLDVKRAVELNNIFYNVFSEDDAGDEIVYTLSTDGSIIKTICGV